jgi:hypothetical protein
MVGSLALNQRVWVRLLPPELCETLFDNAAATPGSVGNRQTTLAQNERCCGFESHLGHWLVSGE